ncbi:MFS transporter [Pseudomonas sp. TH34]|uniref:MFS transporter n=1 Tax=Pseudomonas TaxID=286 RepID=UPI0015A494CD|nr:MULTISPECIES: MFS transporter [Pseudomonas]MBK5410718.1 MFS transporter [Pseudomonas sp. TH34]NVZ91048.1 MFS transporter [Pseudomonas yamanorum]WVN19923.1 MFS transporter [Pseudomonas yamanorum]
MKSPAPRGALAALSLSMLLASLGTSIANVGLPSLVQAFDASFQAAQWVVLAYLLAITAVIVSVGRLGDLMGRSRLLLAGLLLFTVASALCGMAPSLGLLIAARALQGLGAAIMMAMTMALVGETVAQERTGRAMGLLGTMSAMGTALGPSLGGMLIAGFGWRALFFITVPLGLLTFALARRYLRVDRRERQPAQSRFSFLSTLRDSTLSAGLAMSALVSAVMMATLVVGPFYLTHGAGLDPAWMGLTMAVGPCVSALMGVPAGRLTDRFGSGPMTIVGLLAMLTGCLLLALTPPNLGIAGYIGPLIILTLGYAQFQAANNTAVMSDVKADRRGVVAGLLNLSRNLGLIAGASALGAVFARVSGDLATATPADVGSGMRATFGVALALIGVGLFLALRARFRVTPVLTR